MSRHSRTGKQTVITWTLVKMTNPERRKFPELGYEDSLVQPEYIEYDGAEWSVKLQDTFLVDEGKSILAIWTIGTYLRDTLETQVKQLRGAVHCHRQSGELDTAHFYEEQAIAMERDYPHARLEGLVFRGIGPWLDINSKV